MPMIGSDEPSAMSHFRSGSFLQADSPAVDSLPNRSRWDQPGMVALQSAILPGLGQIRNRQIWKVPIIYAGGAVIYYFARENNKLYQEHRQAYEYRTDDDPNTIDPFPYYSDFGLLDLREQYHTARDLTIIVGVIGYAANILDAYVYSHLKDFDVSEDLTMQVQPLNLVNIAGSPACLATLKLNLR